tara:strand:- start:78 stop:500 length:423 start_codon:yes stop_codon:yes gene_type:complete
MKRLLLSLLAAIVLPTAVNSGDLGKADLFIEEVQEGYVFEKKIMLCGGMLSDTQKRCKIKFADGKMIVDDSRGITSDQITNIYWQELRSEQGGLGTLMSYFKIGINYISSEGKKTVASITFTNNYREAARFFSALTNFVN